MWAAFYHHQFASFDELQCSLSSGGDRENPVGVTVNHQGWYVNAFEVVAEIRQSCRDTLQSALWRSAGCDVPTELNGLVADQLATQGVHVVEV
jgi:hypothetical protein